MPIQIKDITLAEFFGKADVSTRSITICENAEILTLFELVDFYEKHKSFKKLRNCGTKTENELVDICKKFLKDRDNQKAALGITNIIDELQPKDIDEFGTIADIDPFYKLIINKYIQYIYSTLSPRPQNGINRFLNYKIEYSSILSEIILKDVDFRKIENVGDSASIELIRFKEKIIEFISEIKLYKPQELNEEYIRIIINSYFIKELLDINQLKSFIKGNRLQLFKLLDFLLQHKALIGDKRLQVFMYTYHESNTENKSLTDIGRDIGLTRERVRQLKVDTEDATSSYLSIIECFRIDDIVDYGLNPFSDFIVIDVDLKKEINQNENLSYNLDFYRCCFEILFKSSHFCLTEFSFDNIQNGRKRNQNLVNKYLISNFYIFFDFNSFIRSVYENLQARKEATYSFPFKGFLISFIVGIDHTLGDTLCNICENLILYEFGLTLDSEHCIVFERNTKKQNFEYVLEVLENKGELMSVTEILSILREQYPELDFQDNNVRMCLKERDIFIYIGRTSTYGLKKWENKIDGLKGGTIRDMVEEYLNLFDEPKHISEISKHVKRYRNTNDRNVEINIHLEEELRFVFFNAGFIGLKTKDYRTIDTKYKKVAGTWFVLNKLKVYNNLKYEDFISKLATLHELRPIQIRAIIDNKIENKQIELTNENRIYIP